MYIGLLSFYKADKFTLLYVILLMFCVDEKTPVKGNYYINTFFSKLFTQHPLNLPRLFQSRFCLPLFDYHKLPFCNTQELVV